MNRNRFLFLSALLLCACGIGTCQEQTAASFVKLGVFAEDGSGQGLAGLKAENFKVQQDKKDLTPAVFLGAESPVLLVFVMDTTGDASNIDALRKELCNFVSALPPSIQVMVMSCNDGLRVLQNNTGDPAKLKEAIMNYNTKGKPGFLEAVVPVAENLNGLFIKHNNVRVAVIFFTDSEIYNYRKRYTTADFTTEAEKTREKLKEISVPMFVMRLPIGNNDTFNRTYEGAVGEMARTTGGEAVYPTTANGITKALVTLLQRIHFTYVLGFPAPEAKSGKEFRVNVSLAGANGKVTHKKSYRLPSK